MLLQDRGSCKKKVVQKKVKEKELMIEKCEEHILQNFDRKIKIQDGVKCSFFF